jgi:hypothetical protein
MRSSCRKQGFVCLPITGKLFGSFANFFDFRRVRLRGSNFAAEVADERGGAMVDFKGIHFPKESICATLVPTAISRRSWRSVALMLIMGR